MSTSLNRYNNGMSLITTLLLAATAIAATLRTRATQFSTMQTSTQSSYRRRMRNSIVWTKKNAALMSTNRTLAFAYWLGVPVHSTYYVTVLCQSNVSIVCVAHAWFVLLIFCCRQSPATSVMAAAAVAAAIAPCFAAVAAPSTVALMSTTTIQNWSFRASVRLLAVR